jgi:hypothetical protein
MEEITTDNLIIRELSLVFENVNDRHVKYINKLNDFTLKEKHIVSYKLCKQPSRIYSDKRIGKYNVHILLPNNDAKLLISTFIFDSGLNLFETERGKRRLINEVSKKFNITKDKILF